MSYGKLPKMSPELLSPEKGHEKFFRKQQSSKMIVQKMGYYGKTRNSFYLIIENTCVKPILITKEKTSDKPRLFQPLSQSN